MDSEQPAGTFTQASTMKLGDMDDNLVITNSEIAKFSNKRDIGIKPGSGRFLEYTQTINTDQWGGRSVVFSVPNSNASTLIDLSRSYFEFRCRAKKGDDTNILPADLIEMRPGAGGLIVQTVQMDIAGSTMYNNQFAPVSAHYQSLLESKEADRANNTILYEAADVQYASVDNLQMEFNGDTEAYAHASITDNKRFQIVRRMHDIPFGSPDSSSIPGALPLSFTIYLTNTPSKLFHAKSSVSVEPKLMIEVVRLRLYTVEMSSILSGEIQKRLVENRLYGRMSRVDVQDPGRSVVSSDTVYALPSSVLFATTPSLALFAMFPTSSYSSPTPYKGIHPLSTTWSNLESSLIGNNGRQLRYYRNTSTLGGKVDMFNDVFLPGEPTITSRWFATGQLGFIPVRNRSLENTHPEASVRQQIEINNTFSPNAGADARVFVVSFHKQNVKFSLDPGMTKVSYLNAVEGV